MGRGLFRVETTPQKVNKKSKSKCVCHFFPSQRLIYSCPMSVLLYSININILSSERCLACRASSTRQPMTTLQISLSIGGIFSLQPIRTLCSLLGGGGYSYNFKELRAQKRSDFGARGWRFAFGWPGSLSCSSGSQAGPSPPVLKDPRRLVRFLIFFFHPEIAWLWGPATLGGVFAPPPRAAEYVERLQPAPRWGDSRAPPVREGENSRLFWFTSASLGPLGRSKGVSRA